MNSPAGVSAAGAPFRAPTGCRYDCRGTQLLQSEPVGERGDGKQPTFLSPVLWSSKLVLHEKPGELTGLEDGSCSFPVVPREAGPVGAGPSASSLRALGRRCSCERPPPSSLTGDDGKSRPCQTCSLPWVFIFLS